MATMAVQAPRTQRSKEIRRHALIYLGLMPFLIIAVFPILWMLITALKQEPDLYRMDVVPFWFHLPPTWKNFDFLFHRTFYGDWIVNTMAISFWVSVITLFTAVPAGYALARLRLPFAENLGIGIFMTYLVPAIILFLCPRRERRAEAVKRRAMLAHRERVMPKHPASAARRENESIIGTARAKARNHCIRKRDRVIAFHFHPLAGNNPHAVFKIELAPSCAQRFLSTDACQDHEF